MWPFKRRSPVEKLLAAMPEIEKVVATRWIDFNSAMRFKDSVSEKDKLGMFLAPMVMGLRNQFPNLSESPDEALCWAITRGVGRSGAVNKEDFANSVGIPIKFLE
jgi:hypothetical protein